MNDLKPQNSDRMSKPAGLARYRVLIFLAVVAVISLGLAFFLTRGTQKGPDVQTGVLPPTAGAASSVSLSPVSPVSPVSPLNLTTAPPGTAPLSQEALQSMVEKGEALYKSGAYTEALKNFEAVVEADPRNPHSYDARGSVYTALGDYTHALDDYNKAVELDSSFAQSYYNRGRVFSMLKEYDQALADLEKSVQLDAPHFGYRANGNIGLIYHRQGKYDKALEAYTASIGYNEANADVFFLRGETYTALEQYEAAIADYQNAITRFPRYASAYQSLGYAYYKTGKNDKAIEELKRAIEIVPDGPGAHFYLALADLATGDLGGASAAMSQAVDASLKLPQEDREFLYTRVTTDLKTFAKENPERAATVESMLKLMPQLQ